MRALVGVLLAVAVVAAAAGIGSHIYNLGVAQGIAQSGKLPSPGAGPYPAYPYPFYPYGGPFHWFGFGFFGLLWVALLFFLFFALARRVYWGGRPWGEGSGRGGPRWLEEWHRHAHEPKGTSGTV